MNKLLFNDRAVLILSIFVALVLWVQVTGGSAREIQRTFTGIPLGWRDIPEGLSVLEMEPAQVDVVLRGDREIMQDLSRDDFVATVSLAGAEAGAINYFVTVSVPRGVQLVQVTPQTVTVDLEVSVEEVFSVSVSMDGEPAMELAEPVVDPPQVVIEGPASRIGEVYNVVARVDVDGLDRELREQVICTPVDIRGEPVRGVLVTPRQIDIVVPLEATQVTRTLPIRPVVFGNLPENLVLREIVADPSEIVVTGPEAQVEDMEYVVTSPVDLGELAGEIADELSEPDAAEAADEDEDTEALGVGDYVQLEVDARVEVPGGTNSGQIRLDPEDVTVSITLQVVDPR